MKRSILIAFAGVLILTFFYNAIPMGGSRDKTYTEIYFGDMDETVQAGDKVEVSFTIKNAEASDTKYTYDVYYKYGDVRETILEPSEITIGKGSKKDIALTFVYPKELDRVKVVVNLTSHDQYIYWWIDKI